MKNDVFHFVATSNCRIIHSSTLFIWVSQFHFFLLDSQARGVRLFATLRISSFAIAAYLSIVLPFLLMKFKEEKVPVDVLKPREDSGEI
jgi:hypothetical protein